MTGNTPYPRSLRVRLVEDLGLYPVVAVVGARQVGKSTLCRDLAEQRGLGYATLDDPQTLNAAIADPSSFVARIGAHGAFIDEAQRAPGVFLAIKAIVDRVDRPGQFLLSGSNQPKMSSAVGDSLLGRAVYRTLRPLSLSELRLSEAHGGWSFLFDADDRRVQEELARRAASHGPLDWVDVVTTGGFPRAVLAPPSRRLEVLDGYVRAFASRDIREVIGVDSIDRFESFLRLTATRIGHPLNYSGLAADLGLSVNTVRRWLDALGRSYLIELVPAYSRSAGQRVVKAPKLFAVDSALALAAAREVQPNGFHLENLVATDLAIWRDGEYTRAVYHWRLHSGQEVDFVAAQGSALLPVEVKTSSSVGRNDARHLRSFLETHPEARRAVLLSSDPDIRDLGANVLAAPWWAVL